MAVDVVVDDDVVLISFSGIERLLALRSRVILPTDAVDGAYVAPAAEVGEGLGWRPFGTRVPGVVTAGSFTADDEHGGHQLWCVERDDEVLVLDLVVGEGQPYDRVVLQHPDRHDLAWWIGERIPVRT